jgi:hypothetical protein
MLADKWSDGSPSLQGKEMQMCNEWRNVSFYRGVIIREVPKFLENSFGLVQNNVKGNRNMHRIATKSQLILFCCVSIPE